MVKEDLFLDRTKKGEWGKTYNERTVLCLVLAAVLMTKRSVAELELKVANSGYVSIMKSPPDGYKSETTDTNHSK